MNGLIQLAGLETLAQYQRRGPRITKGLQAGQRKRQGFQDLPLYPSQAGCVVTDGRAKDWQARVRSDAVDVREEVSGEGLSRGQEDCALFLVQGKAQGLRLGFQDR